MNADDRSLAVIAEQLNALLRNQVRLAAMIRLISLGQSLGQSAYAPLNDTYDEIVREAHKMEKQATGEA